MRRENLVGENAAFLQCLEQASRAAEVNRPVIVCGERGTGKELVAARIHYLSSRWDKPFVKLNCAAINENLLESELFGHEAGSFTGASKRRPGRFELADSGSLFLDEIASSSAMVQEKLLRVVEYGEFERVGGTQTLQVDVRLIAATHEDLPTLVDQGRFRADLLDRLAFDVITLPPLRHRRDDIPLLARHFATQMARQLGWSHFPGFSKDVMKQMMNYPWPGNVRELKNAVERALYMSEPESVVVTWSADPFASPFRPVDTARTGVVADSLKLPTALKDDVRELEITLIRKALAEARFQQTEAARLLGLSYHQLRGYLRKYHLTGSGTDSVDKTDAP
jgi:psp operon transcriptional activator